MSREATQVNLSRAISNFKPRAKSVLLPVYEAITNSIYAGANKIDITFQTLKDVTLEELPLEKSNTIANITITDNGEGFTSDNRKSFSTLYSDYKINLGAKGIGRLSYLKAFENVKICSITKDMFQVYIKFDLPFTENKIRIKKLDKEHKQETTIVLSDCKKDFQTSLTLEQIKNKIIEHFSVLLFFRERQNIQINLSMNDNFECITNNDIPKFNKHPFKITKNNVNNATDIANFNIYYFIDKTSGKDGIEGYYCANERQVEKFKDRGVDITLPSKTSGMFFITSKYFDDRVNDERDEFTISENETDYLFHWLSFNEIKAKVEEEIYNILKSEFPDIDAWNKKQIEEFKNENPELIGFIDENPKSFFIKKNEKLKALEKMQKLENDFESKKSKKNREQIITEAEKIGALKLTSYLKYRKEIIEQFEKYDFAKIDDENKVHNSIIPKYSSGSNYTPIPLENNNLWLLDDKFMSYNYVASEGQLKKIITNINSDATNSSEERPDIAIYVNNQKNPSKVILIELKKFNSTYKEGVEGLAQLRNYATQLKNEGVQEIYCYLIANIDDKFKNDIIIDDYNKLFSQEGEIWQKYFEKINTLFHIMSPKALISDAKARNQTFLDFIINKQKIHNTNETHA